MRSTERTVIGGGRCRACGEVAASRASFCSRCGSAIGSPVGPAGPVGTYAVLGFVALSVLVIAAWSAVWPDDFHLAYGRVGTTTAPPPEGTIALEEIDPRQVADNLFNHVVDAAAEGDSVELHAFLPMALTAYAEAGPLDADGLFHLSVLQRIGQTPDESLMSARGILEIDPDHLLGLGAAAVASEELGRSAEAAGYYARFVQVFDQEVDRTLTVYVGHASFLTRVESDAASLLGAR